MVDTAVQVAHGGWEIDQAEAAPLRLLKVDRAVKKILSTSVPKTTNTVNCVPCTR